MSRIDNFGGLNLMNVAQLDSMLERIKEESGLTTVRVIFNGSGNVQIFLSDSWPEDTWGRTAIRNVPIEQLTGDYDFNWITDTAKRLTADDFWA